MKFTKHTFLMLGLASMFSLCIVDMASGASDCKSAPTAGLYCEKKNKKPSCPRGCYCPGGYKKAVDNGDGYTKLVTSHCSAKTASVKAALEASGVFYCPDDYPLSGYGASQKWHCHDSNQVYYSSTPYCNTTTTKTKPGKFCALNVQHACPEGCYCPGNGNYYTASTEQNVTNSCKDSTEYGTEMGGGAFRCPKDTPYSYSGAKSASECYKIDTYTSCAEGKYLPEGAEKSSDAKPCLPGYYCPGVRMTKSPVGKDVGLRKCAADKIPNAAQTGCESCPDGKVPNSEQTACEEPPIECAIGTYLPENSTSESDCTKCPEGYYCPGGQYPKRVFDQGYYRCPPEGGEGDVPNSQRTGCVSCPAGKEPDEDHATCVDKKTFVAPGWYFKENSVEPVPCTGAKKFCPGGKFYKKSVEQGRYDCPFNSNANSAHSGCSVKLTQEQMKNGVSGKGNCWKITDPEDYKYCIYGVRFLENEEVLDEMYGTQQGCEASGCIWKMTNGSGSCVCPAQNPVPKD